MTSFCIPSSMESWRGMSHRSSLCLHAVVFTQFGIRLNRGPLRTCRSWTKYSSDVQFWNQQDFCRESVGVQRNADKCWNSVPLFLHPLLSTIPSSVCCIIIHILYGIQTDSTNAAIQSFNTLQRTQRLFITALNAKCRIRGSGAWTGLTESEKKKKKRRWIYVTRKVTTSQSSWADSMEVGWG